MIWGGDVDYCIMLGDDIDYASRVKVIITRGVSNEVNPIAFPLTNDRIMEDD